jgi:hypothetical protein
VAATHLSKNEFLFFKNLEIFSKYFLFGFELKRAKLIFGPDPQPVAATRLSKNEFLFFKNQ